MRIAGHFTLGVADRAHCYYEGVIALVVEGRGSNGSWELRPVIETTIDIGGHEWPIELTLTRRDVMGFRMLLGRQGIRGHGVIDPGRSFLTRRKSKKPKSSKKPKLKKAGSPSKAR